MGPNLFCVGPFATVSAHKNVFTISDIKIISVYFATYCEFFIKTGRVRRVCNKFYYLLILLNFYCSILLHNVNVQDLASAHSEPGLEVDAV